MPVCSGEVAIRAHRRWKR